jgi:surfactin family lipopeptide synthetase C
VPPRNAVEQVLAGLWAPVLGAERVGVHDNFFELGGHSLLATQVVARIREELEIDLELRHLFESPTVAGLAAALLADPQRRGQVERAAALTLELARMTDDEIDALLTAEAVDSPEGTLS